MTPAPAAPAPIERVTIPLRPRTAAGCCDLAVLFYGRHVGPALRLWLAVAGPAVALVYGFGRFVGTDFALAAVTAILVSKPLGLLTVAAAVRTTFGEPFERPPIDRRPDRARRGRLWRVARAASVLSVILATAFFVAATLDDAYGPGRLAARGPGTAAAAVTLAAVLLVAGAQPLLADRHLTGGMRRAVLLGIAQRVLLAAPLTLLFFDETAGWGIAVVLLWLPLAGWVAARGSFRAERRALEEIEPGLHTARAGSTLASGETVGPAILIAAATAGLTVVLVVAADFAFRTAGLPGPITGPAEDLFDPEAFDPGAIFAAIGRSPLFAAVGLAAALFAYQLGRIAWYFAYLDARVRHDCWDMELLLAREATRLTGERRP